MFLNRCSKAGLVPITSMQHLNYFVLRQLTHQMQTVLAGGRLQDAFTQERDELVLVFRTAEGHPWFLRVSCRNALQFVLPQTNYRRARSNSVDLFEPLQDQPFLQAELAPGDRVIALHLADGHTLYLKMHGPQSNVIHAREGEVQELFRQKLSPDWDFRWPERPLQLPQSSAELTELLANTTDRSPGQALYKTYPVLDKSFGAAFNDLLEAGRDPWEAWQALARTASQPQTYYVGKRGDGQPVFALFALPELEEPTPFTDLQEALQAFVGKWFFRWRYQALQNRLQKALEKLQKQAESKVDSNRRGLERLRNARSPEELGHILMANLHAIPPEAESVRLPDYYNNEQEIEIRLNPKLSPQENAEAYYQKHKDNKKKIQHLQALLQQSEDWLRQVQELQQTYAGLRGLKALEKFARKHRKTLKLGDQSSKHAGGPPPFRHYQFQGFDVYVGRSAANNDRLTLGFARKEDLWLHAKDVQGSHVVIRKQKDQHVPETVLEFAAGLAAWFSKLRSSGLVPVSYTPRKYIRKPKRLAPGQVIVEREEVMLIEPTQPPEQVA